ncbi:cytochrome ubiquinol oxidase subunit I [Hydrogenophaga sp.]|uniref:cytochrome ubiquinol oxidase subunit I n=1 Tax=Hydrogenophaga sp. TaxID=1904254 RepID=UPI0025B8CFE3|nr:cytochrome ubiquinol oxidase subunit I [Hydrogenophaga sp.]MDO9505234.1 cytochrome ubiquinol oxidase subunit I [Hydrogenophaga sp.]MDP2075256.1 cytochrome ubiquinol oxidase subunit I [Hydrogenophaga sp.]MDP3109669.1 cytochrome ubiquinol oxidase subunit I [Hydrogenophaga sp.]MDP3347741.1 cytochrome ubiquinol oxidase subunit I [Hydrogenophaga sp.]MDZ4283589.1 cytochrome ubiquinol oxidase subunit I [Hydrogenophaga sp.]
MDALILSRIQFAANISFHILFPTITIAMCWFLLFFRLRFIKTRDPAWEEAYYFWTKVFALTFALGVVSGIVMSFQFGTNWPGFMEKTGNISGPLLGYEVLTAFFLEASFLGIMLFGRGRVSERVHLAATFLVAFGTTMSAFWILSLNSWLQTPAGFEIVNGQFYATDWWAVVFNPSFPYRFSHKLLASALTASFLIAGLCAWQLIKGSATAGTHKAMRTALVAAAIVIPIQFVAGDLHGLNTLEHQPAKVAAMEGIWDTQKGAPLTLFGIPDEEAGETHFAIKIPKLASLILAHDLDAEIQGINDFKGAHPPVAPVFWSFRVMVGTGTLMMAVAWFAAWQLWRKRKQMADGKIRLPRPLLWVLAGMTFSGWVATLSGWYVTEIGRQPFMVYGLLRTSEIATDIAPSMIALTLTAYLIVYGLLLVTYIGVLKYMAENPFKHAPIPGSNAALGKAGV